MMSIRMGEYTLYFIAALLVSPQSYGKPSEKMALSTSAMTIFGTFVQSSIPLEDKLLEIKFIERKRIIMRSL